MFRYASGGVFRSLSRTGPTRPRRFYATWPEEKTLRSKLATKIAVIDPNGDQHSYGALFRKSDRLRGVIPSTASKIVFLTAPSSDYVSVFLMAWRTNRCAVPLCTSHPVEEQLYVLEDIKGGLKKGEEIILISDAAYEARAAILSSKSGVGHVVLPEDRQAPDQDGAELEPAADEPEAPGLVIYTSGTTGRPKGVVMRQRSLLASMQDMAEAWRWKPEDYLLHFLPLHHVHGVVNKLLTPLSVGATVHFLPKFEPSLLWSHLSSPSSPVTLFMAVPAIYFQLIQLYNKMSDEDKKKASKGANRLRLFVSGSAALPVTHFADWKSITGHRILERYGMTEFGMGLTNPYEPASDRQPGCVGRPFPSISVKLLDPTTQRELEPKGGREGLLCVAGEPVFKEYYNKPGQAQKEFTPEGYFITGDVARYDSSLRSWQILGRASVDIIKTNAYKVSALEIERVMLESPAVAEVSVFGVPDERLGEKIVAVLRPFEKDAFRLEDLQEFLSERLAKYKLPKQFIVVDEIARNQMGKVNKKELQLEYFPQ